MQCDIEAISVFHTGRTVMDVIEKFAVFGRYWQPAQAHVVIHSQYVGDCGATAPESRRKSAKTEKIAFRCKFRDFCRCQGMSAEQTGTAG